MSERECDRAAARTRRPENNRTHEQNCQKGSLAVKKLFRKENISKFLLGIAIFFFAVAIGYLIYGIFENVIRFLPEIVSAIVNAGIFLALYRIIDLLEHRNSNED